MRELTDAKKVHAFAIFDERFIVTANKDGSIPLNSRVVCDLPKGGFQIGLLEELVRRANAYEPEEEECEPEKEEMDIEAARLDAVRYEQDYERGCRCDA